MSRRRLSLIVVSVLAGVVLLSVGSWRVVQRSAQPQVLPTVFQLPATAIAQQQPTHTTVPPTQAPTDTPIPPPTTTDTQVPAASPSPTTTNTAQPTATDVTVTTAATSAPSATPVELTEEELLQPVENTLMIQFNTGTTASERADYLASIGATVKQEIEAADTVVVTVADTALVTANASASGVVAQTEPDYYVTTQDVYIPPTDPGYFWQWALPAIGYSSRWYNLPPDPQTIRVAVVDSGVCMNHPELAGRVLSGYDFVEDDSDPTDENGHGCGVAGVIAANADNGLGIAGGAPNTVIIPIRVLDENGNGTYSDVISGIYEAANHNADVINLSLGGTSSSIFLETAVNYAHANGILVIAAAGNAGSTTIIYPAAYPNAVSVGSVDSDQGRSSFSNYGAGVDLYAPGGSIYTLSLNNSYRFKNGTSFAAPYVSAVAALQMANGEPVLTQPVLLWETEDEISSNSILPPPTVKSVVPGNLASGIDPNANLTITFDQPVKAGAGTIIIATDDTEIEQIAVTSDRVQINGDTVTVDPVSLLSHGTSYSVVITKDAFLADPDN